MWGQEGEPTDTTPTDRELLARIEPVLHPDTDRVLVLLMDHHLGNVVIHLSLTRALTAYFEKPIDVVVDARWADLVARLPGIGRLHRYPPRQKASRDGWWNHLRNCASIAGVWGATFARRYRAVIDLTAQVRSTSLCLTTAARTRIGPADGPRAWVYTHRIDAPHGPHVYERSATLLRCIGRTEPPEPIRLHATDESRQRVDDELARAFASPPGATAHPLVVIHPSAGKAYRQWPAERFAAVADGLVEQAEARVVIIGTPQERELGERIRAAMRTPDAAAYLALPVADLLALFERAAVIVSNESGPTHLASTTDLPIVTIFGPTREQLWRPLRQERTTLLRGADCDPGCGRRVCVAGHRCLLELPVERVLEHALVWVQGTEIRAGDRMNVTTGPDGEPQRPS